MSNDDSQNDLLRETVKAFAGLSDKGKVRKKNEDSWGVDIQQALFFVADGIGGMPAGEVASMLIAEVLPELLKQRINDIEALSSTEIIASLKQAITDLSNRILKESQQHAEYAGMGSTLVMLMQNKQSSYIAHLGDSRAYLFKNNTLAQITNDHTLINHLLMTRSISPQQVSHHPGKNQLVQYVGMQGTPRPGVICLARETDEKLLLCSDGLTDMLTKQQINEIFRNSSEAEIICQNLVLAANQAGGKDNITVLVVG